MRFVTVKDQENSNCIRLVHLHERDWQPDDVPESLMRDLFEDWDFVNDALDDDFVKSLEKKAFSL